MCLHTYTYLYVFTHIYISLCVYTHIHICMTGGGSTANIGLLLDQSLYIANIGDTRAVLSRAGFAHELSEDHKPDRPSGPCAREHTNMHTYTRHTYTDTRNAHTYTHTRIHTYTHTHIHTYTHTHTHMDACNWCADSTADAPLCRRETQQ
jgi:hypothetical protein